MEAQCHDSGTTGPEAKKPDCNHVVELQFSRGKNKTGIDATDELEQMLEEGLIKYRASATDQQSDEIQ